MFLLVLTGPTLNDQLLLFDVNNNSSKNYSCSLIALWSSIIKSQSDYGRCETFS